MRNRIAIAAATCALAFTLLGGMGLPGGWVGRIYVHGDSNVNETELSSMATILGIEEKRIWMFGEGGVSAYEAVLNGNDLKCNSLNADPYEQLPCRFGIFQVKQMDGACRSFASWTTDIAGNATQEARCTGNTDPIDGCTGSSAGNLVPTCVADLPRSAQDHFIIMFGTNDAFRTEPHANWCGTGSALPEYKRDIEAMVVEYEAYGITGVISSAIPNLELFADTNDLNGNIECMRDWILNTLKPAYPTHQYVDLYQIFRDYQTEFGDAAFAGLYANCGTPLPCSDASDGIHLGSSPNSLGISGREFMAKAFAQALVGLRNSRVFGSLGVLDTGSCTLPAVLPCVL